MTEVQAKALAALEAGCWVERTEESDGFNAWCKRAFMVMLAGTGKTPMEALANAAEWGGWTPGTPTAELTLDMVEEAARQVEDELKHFGCMSNRERAMAADAVDMVLARLDRQMGGQQPGA